MHCLGSFSVEHNIGCNRRTSPGLLDMCVYVLEKSLRLEFTSVDGLVNDSAVRMDVHELVYDGFGIAVCFSRLV